MFDRVALKAEARERMRTAQPGAVGATLIVIAVSYGITLVYLYFTQRSGPQSLPVLFLDVLSALLSWVLMAGLTSFLLAVHRRQLASYNQLMDGFGMAGRVIWLNFRMNLQIGLWSLLFVIPGIIAAYRYSFALYCLLDDPTLSAGDAIRRSCELTSGRKMDLFVLELSFVGWSLLIGAVVTVIGTVIAMLMPDIFLRTIMTPLGETVDLFPQTVLIFLMMLLPMAWLSAYIQLAEIGFYRKTAPDSPAEHGPAGGAMPWEG